MRGNMIVQIKCFVCDGLTLDNLECQICEGKGQIEDLLKLSINDLKIWAERLLHQQQELDAQQRSALAHQQRYLQARAKLVYRLEAGCSDAPARLDRLCGLSELEGKRGL